MSLIDYLATSPVAWIIIAGILGLLVGSFLNVVIYRLPIILEREWTEQCAELRDQASHPEAVFTLSRPRSACPHCGHAITALENIPVISYLFLAGKCKACRTPISIRYPTIEALSALVSVIIAWHFGFGWSAVGALLLSWALIPLTFIDVDHQLLPDKITLPLIWLGLAFNLSGVYTDLHSSVIGAIAGYVSLWSIYHLFKLVTGKEGMGYGDFKLLAALGAWLGWQALPMIVLLSSFVGALIGITLVLLKQHQREIPIPFGPYLAIAGWIALVWGEIINSAYLHWSGLV
ncbi:MAG: A24 family peptidase [Pseudomonadota bacterium]|uniref:prepilin peptidase n=1 Tax=Methylophaga aminisulfidivorans TaxID=230105 RepID=UPI0024E24AF7|nr:A24 family peptidase [Methylophaga aminisulfidivorans]MEC9413657.1 A24 family peptidase [Pseudomonadota bacterium]